MQKKLILMTKTIDFYFDFVSPYTFISFQQIKKLKFKQDFLSKCMKESKLPFKYFNNFHVAYHIDTYKFGQYLKDSLLKNDRVTHIEGIVDEVNKNDKVFYLPMSSNFLKDINYVKKEVVLNLDLNFIED